MDPETPYPSIVSLPNSNSSKNQSDGCLCGAVMEPRHTTLFCDGQSWEVVLQVCSMCHPVPSVAFSHDA